jgi:hypothetical protein
MSLALLTPAALAALLALLVPVLLHLVRRPQQRAVDFAALRWIAVVQRPQRRLVFEERLLLVLRLLMLALLALLLATPVLLPRATGGEWVAVIPGADLARGPADRAHARWVWLAPGFPGVAEPMPASGQSASLLRELDASLPPDATLDVVVPEVLPGLDGARLGLGRDVGWIVAGEGTVRLPTVRPPAPVLAARFPASREAPVRYLAASVAAWQVEAPGTAAIDAAHDTALPQGAADTLAWLHEGPLPDAVRDWVATGRTVVLEPDDTRAVDEGAGVPVWRSTSGDVLARSSRLGAGRVVQLTRPLQPDALPELLEPAFPDALIQMLAPPALPDAAPASAHVPLRLQQSGSGSTPGPERKPLFAWLAIAIAVLVLVERVLATRASRWAA